MRVKLCGLRAVHEVHLAAELGAWACGFVFHPPSPRHLTLEQAAVLSREAAGLVRVGVFARQDVDTILRTAGRVGLDAVQLHRPWGAGEVARLHRAGLQVIGLVRTSSSGRGCDGARATGGGRRPRATASRREDAGPQPDLYLLEPWAGGVGGTGAARHWAALAAGPAPPRPLLLAGGLTPENLPEAVAALEPDGVDVSSGIESVPGRKDPGRMRAFMERVAEIDAERAKRDRNR